MSLSEFRNLRKNSFSKLHSRRYQFFFFHKNNHSKTVSINRVDVLVY